jgi:predicted MFS family arabinose efflux permease
MPPVVLLAAARPVLAPFVAMGLCWGAFHAAMPDLLAMLGVGEGRLGLLLLAAPVAAVSAMLAAARTGAMLGRMALPLATVAMAAAFALPGHMAEPLLFALAMAACGAATGTLDVLMNARVAAIETARGMHLMNFCHAFYAFGYAAAAFATGAMRAAGWSPAAVLTVAAVAAAMTALTALERDGRIAGLSRPAGDGGGLGRLPVLGGLVVLVAFLTENAAEAWSALHIERTLGGSAGEGASGPAVLALTAGIARLVGQGIIARVQPVRLLQGGAVIAAAGALIAAAAGSPAVAYAGFVVMGIGASVLAPTALSLVGRLATPEARARAIARATVIGYGGYFFGPPLLGFIAGSFGLRFAFATAAAALMAVLVLAPALRRGLAAARP